MLHSSGANRQLLPKDEHRREVRLEISAGEPDLPALRSVMREWLVPRLVEDFLRERGIELKYSRVQIPKNPTSKI
jgi:hypothetical protein